MEKVKIIGNWRNSRNSARIIMELKGGIVWRIFSHKNSSLSLEKCSRFHLSVVYGRKVSKSSVVCGSRKNTDGTGSERVSCSASS